MLARTLDTPRAVTFASLIRSWGTDRSISVFVPGFISNLDLAWEDPARAQVWTRLAAFSRLILFDKRGTGLSDRTGGVPTL